MKRIILVTMAVLTLVTGCLINRMSNTRPVRLIDAGVIVGALKHKGLSIKSSKEYTEETDPDEMLGKPNCYVSKAGFTDASVRDINGIPSNFVEVFETQQDAWNRYQMLLRAKSKEMIKSEYLYLEGVYLLRLTNVLKPAEAERYFKAFREAVRGK